MDRIMLTSSPWGFRLIPLVEQCKWLKNMGIEHICGQFFENMNGLFAPTITDQQITQSLLLVKKSALKYASFNANGDFSVENNVIDQIALSCNEIDKASKFDPKVIIVFAGWQDRDDGAVYEQVSNALKQVAKHAARYGLTVALENHGGLTATAAQINRILDKVDEPNIGINYDPANFLMYGADPLQSLQELKHPVVFTHFKSLKYIDAKKEYCRLSEGVIDYPPILKQLEAMHYSGFYALEYEDPSDVFDGSESDLKSLKKLLS